MKAAQLVGPKQFVFLDEEMPRAEDGECLIKLERVSICGSDIRHGYGPIYEEEKYPWELGRPCHECAGVVVESRTDEFREGQRVLVMPVMGQGGLIEYMTAKPGRMIALPDHGDLAEWVMCQPSATVLYSCQKMGNVSGKRILVIGQGAIGLSFTMITSRQGAAQVIAVDPLDYRLEYSRKFGATHTVNPDKQDLAEAVNDITGGIGPDITVEAAGYPETLDTALRLVRPFGTVILFGIPSDDLVPLDIKLVMDKQATIIPTVGMRAPDLTVPLKDMVALRERGWVDPAAMVTHRVDFNAVDVKRAYDMYENHSDNIIKVVISI